MRAAYRAAGPQAVTGFRQVLEAMMDRDTRAGAMTWELCAQLMRIAAG